MLGRVLKEAVCSVRIPHCKTSKLHQLEIADDTVSTDCCVKLVVGVVDSLVIAIIWFEGVVHDKYACQIQRPTFDAKLTNTGCLIVMRCVVVRIHIGIKTNQSVGFSVFNRHVVYVNGVDVWNLWRCVCLI